MIILIGPAFPWKGGVAHHTNNLVNALLDEGEQVKILTFSRQYPKFLYPGKRQQEPLGTSNPLKTDSVKILNPINPFTWRSTFHYIVHEKPTHCILQYWHPFFVPCFSVMCWLLRRKGIKTICIVQTLIPHDRHYADTFFMRIFFSQIDRAVLDESMQKQFKNYFPRLPYKLIQLPVFDNFGDPVDIFTARKHLGLPQDKKILLFFGFIRKYKGLDILLEAFSEILQCSQNIHLAIAGECFGEYDIYQRIILRHNLIPHITSHIAYIPNEDVKYWFCSCDLLVMPYRHIINSGVENIGKIYAKKSLMTSETIPKNLANRILYELSLPSPKVTNKFGWKEYAKELISFLDSF